MLPAKHRMRVNVVLAVTIFAASAYAEFPLCAQTCIPELGSGGKGATLAACGDSSLISDAACCINTSCGTDDQSTAIGYIAETCGSAGLPVSVSLLQCAAAASSSTASVATVTLISTASAKTSSSVRTKTSRPVISDSSTSSTSGTSSPGPSNTSASSSAAADASHTKPGLPVGAIAAIAIGGTVLVIIIALPLTLFFIRRRRQRFAALDDVDPKTPQYPELSTEANTHELEEKNPVHRAEMGADDKQRAEMGADDKQRAEMGADDKQRTELEGVGYYKYGWNGHQDDVMRYELDGQSHGSS